MHRAYEYMSKEAWEDALRRAREALPPGYEPERYLVQMNLPDGTARLRDVLGVDIRGWAHAKPGMIVAWDKGLYYSDREVHSGTQYRDKYQVPLVPPFVLVETVSNHPIYSEYDEEAGF